MRSETLLWAGVTVYFAGIATIYGAVGGNAAGVVVLVAAAAFGGLVAGWSWRWSHANAARPADVATADAGDELGVAGGFTIAMIGLALGSWMVVIGIALLCSQVGLVVRDRDG